jgi:hypothetical protein
MSPYERFTLALRLVRAEGTPEFKWACHQWRVSMGLPALNWSDERCLMVAQNIISLG